MACRLNGIRIVGNEYTAMTAFTTVTYAWMYISHEGRRGKTASAHVAVTFTALRLCRDVVHLLRCCDTAVMAGCTITAHDTQVMDKGAGECTKAAVNEMARSAVQVSRYMTKGFAFTDIAVMTDSAIAGICGVMVKRHISKVGRNMANATIIVEIGWYVIRQLTYTDSIIVTGVTPADERRA